LRAGRIPDDPDELAAARRMVARWTEKKNDGPLGAGIFFGFLTAIGIVLTVFRGLVPWLPVTVALVVFGGLAAFGAARQDRRIAVLSDRLIERVEHV
jgi:hypothetical protein